MTVVYYKVDYLPVGVRICFWVNCGGLVLELEENCQMKKGKMAKNGRKLVEIFWGASHMIRLNLVKNKKSYF